MGCDGCEEIELCYNPWLSAMRGASQSISKGGSMSGIDTQMNPSSLATLGH